MRSSHHFQSHLRTLLDKECVVFQQPDIQDEDLSLKSDEGKPILCRQCRHAVTTTAEIIEKHGSHAHTFANPDGILFEIGCFRNAPGCGYLGSPTEEWSWFKGFRWKIALCSQCLTHLGWMYVSGEGEWFHGLILNRLIFSAYAW